MVSLNEKRRESPSRNGQPSLHSHPSLSAEEARFVEVQASKSRVLITTPEDKHVEDIPINLTFSDESVGDSYDDTKRLFDKANEYIKPGPFFRFITWLYGERKLLVFFWLHFAATMIVWFHYGLVKFQEQKDTVPDGAPHYWWKRIAPALEFGSMHAILLQMALLPLTMIRLSIASATDSFVDRFIPLNRAMRIHIHLGYTMVLIVFMATLFFFTFFGRLCIGGEQDFCAKFRSEIMITGYVILVMLFIIGGTSYFRYKIPYEVFYVIHHIVFILYAVTILHTFDNVQRNHQRERSQTFKWFSATILYYVCDRVAMNLNHKYRCPVVSSSLTAGHNGARMIILKVRRPTLFQFKPGQYAFLKLREIGTHWHPFSIASDPANPNLEFYIEVFGEKSWTGKLWKILEENRNGESEVPKTIEIEVLGPCGTSLARTQDYSHALAIGTGTGIVPIMSLFKQHVHSLLRLSPEAHFKAQEEQHRKMHDMETASLRYKSSMAQNFLNIFSCRRNYVNLNRSRADILREYIRQSISMRDAMGKVEGNASVQRMCTSQMKRAAFVSTRSIYGVVLLACLPIFGLTLLGLTISWNTIDIELYPAMVDILKSMTVAFQATYALCALFFWNGNHLFTYLDTLVCIVTPFVDRFWFHIYDTQGTLRPIDITTFSLWTGYMVFRGWAAVVRPRHRSWQSIVDHGISQTMECLDLVWVSRSASLVAEILPDISDAWESLVKTWGEEQASQVCRVNVYITDTDVDVGALVAKELSQTILYQKGFIHFGRPDFGRIIEDHSIDLIRTRSNSYSLLAFCGSPKLAQDLHHCKISNDMVVSITGNKRHQMEFVSESYGGVRSQIKSQKGTVDNSEEEEL